MATVGKEGATKERMGAAATALATALAHQLKADPDGGDGGRGRRVELREILTQVLDERGIARGAARRVPLRRGHAVGRDHEAQRVLVKIVASCHVQKLFELAEARVDPRHQVGRALRSHRVDGRDAALDARGVALGPVDEHLHTGEGGGGCSRRGGGYCRRGGLLSACGNAARALSGAR